MASIHDSKATEPDSKSAGESKSKLFATLNAADAFGEKEDDPLHGILSSPPTSGGFHQELTETFIGYWWQGIVACVIMLTSLMAIILVLGLYQNQPLPNWPLKITINSLVSIMVVLLKSTMLAIVALGLNQTKWNWFKIPRSMTDYPTYDKGSHGPENALVLLWTLRGKQILASIGLLVIIIAGAIDPFTQQVIHYYESNSPSNVTGNATLPRTSQYEIGGPHVGAGLSAIDNAMLGVILGGFWTPSTVSNTVPVNCFTGNCTFTEPYHSIAMCSSCIDLSGQLGKSCGSNGYCNYTLPSGTVLSEIYQQWMTGNNAWGSATIPSAVGATFGNREFIWATSSSANPYSAGCYLYPCLNTYTANVNKSILTEKLIKSTPMPGIENCITALRKDCLTTADWVILSGSTINITPSSYPNLDYIPYCNSTDAEAYNITQITTACVYDFGISSKFSLQYFFDAIGGFNAGSFLDGSLTGVIESETTGPSDLYYLYNSGSMVYANISTAYANIANAMSVQMRVGMVGFGNASLPTQGQIYFTQTLLRVEWRWLSLPLLLVILTLIFLGALMIRTSINAHKPLGDAFSLALLYTAVTGHRESDALPDLRPDGLWHRLLSFVGLKKDETRQQEARRETVEGVQIQVQKIEDGSLRLMRSN